MEQFISEKLKQSREDADLSIDSLMIELANMGLTVHTNTLRNWESGNSVPGADDLAVIASFYKKPVKYFFARNDNQNS